MTFLTIVSILVFNLSFFFLMKAWFDDPERIKEVVSCAFKLETPKGGIHSHEVKFLALLLVGLVAFYVFMLSIQLYGIPLIFQKNSK